MTLIPQCNPLANYLAHRDAIDDAIREVLEKGQYVLGENVAAFEREFAAYVGVGHAVGVASGTDALTIGLRACGIGDGDEVITVSHTAVATVAAIELAGASPVFVDIDEGTYTIDVSRIEAAITPATKAIMPVHLYGKAASLDELIAIARSHGLMVIEDCAQAHGALCGAAHGARRVGSIGDIGAFSFYPTKNLGALGDGGMIVTGNAEYAEQARSLRQYGWQGRRVSERAGMNSRLDEIQAAVLRVKLKGLERENERRRRIARHYGKILASLGCAAPVPGDDSHVYHQYVIAVDRRDAVSDLLLEKGISTAVHYPVPVHLQPAYRGRLHCCGTMAVTERTAQRIISLPMFPELSVEDAVFVAESVRASITAAAAAGTPA
jgi:dTDP-4-amino-4,6-dideoxygalactose transaminase